ncbi:hypothetical protein Desor_2036 [Desulfosporosinus orientis DSM 765]|uniref:Uncharacterized protein n=1 Tax=Desulfosporosinus orientis (strain ATCC 19365 / DSM 765 / NCIMB 8382 / VKM B-1628 / Singapore I) TaxID=768706 RepID=G7WF34_DESOD|nr:hypothetical protein Desor_2036 [Desulfosporosinus orientis DSM 765]
MGIIRSFWEFLVFFGNWLWPYEEESLRKL